MEALREGGMYLSHVFQGDVDKFVVYVTPFIAEHFQDPFPSLAHVMAKETTVPSMMCDQSRARSVELANAIVLPFEHIPVTIAELRLALNSKLLRKLLSVVKSGML